MPLSNEEKYKLIRSVGSECIQEDELKKLIESGNPIICYDGFECSGRMHISQGLLKVINVNKLTEAGCKFRFWVADIFAELNQKLDGRQDRIKDAGLLMIETWKACGMNMNNVEFLWSWEEINKDASRYWKLVLDIANVFDLHRIKKCTQIMGRDDDDNLMTGQIFYPVMQCADIFYIGVNICQLGEDQRKVNVLAREYAAKKKLKYSPIILSHPMLPGLDGSTKMAKSNPNNAIFMDDSEAEVNRKVKKAFCAPSDITTNPLMEYAEHLVLPRLGHVKIIRTDEHGGNLEFNEIESLRNAFVNGELHPADFKLTMAKHINEMLRPVRKYFEENQEAEKLRKKVSSFTKSKESSDSLVI
jgi:tyrosyl-tRNA synthetase